MQADVVELALMQLSERWIPVDFEAKLHATGDSFARKDTLPMNTFNRIC